MSTSRTVIVIGGGLGGLSAAISLAQKGYKVRLFEKNHHLGGKLNRLTKDGFTFDLGPSILTMPQIFEKLFRAGGRDMDDYVKIRRLELEWRSFFPDGSVIDLYGDLDRMAAANPGIDPKHMEEYKSFLAYARNLYDATDKGYFEMGLDNTSEVLWKYGLLRSLKGFDLFSTMHEGIAKYITHPRLVEMFDYFIKYVGSSPYDAPAVLNMMIYMQHKQGVWYVPGGMYGLAEGLIRLAQEAGVELNTDAEVVRMIRKGDRSIEAIELADGTKVTGDVFVSNMEVLPAYDKLLGEKEYADKKRERFEPACSGLVLHLGVDRLYPQLAHHNFFFSSNPRGHFNKVFHSHELPDDPILYVVNSSKTDPGQARPGHENIKILPHIPYMQEKDFSREEYMALRERVLVKMENMGITDLRKHIVTEDMWIPSDIRRMYNSDRGAIYGTLSDKKKNKGFKNPKKSELFENLYFVGGTVNPGGGMPMVTLSGQKTSELIVKDIG